MRRAFVGLAVVGTALVVAATLLSWARLPATADQTPRRSLLDFGHPELTVQGTAHTEGKVVLVAGLVGIQAAIGMVLVSGPRWPRRLAAVVLGAALVALNVALFFLLTYDGPGGYSGTLWRLDVGAYLAPAGALVAATGGLGYLRRGQPALR